MITFLRSIVNIVNYINVHPLAKKHKVIAYSKFIKWQLFQFIIHRERVVSFTDKTFLAVKKGMTGATGNIYLGLHEFNDMGFMLHFLREGDVFFDIGANIGSYTILASGHCKAKSISFEPITATFQTLKKNIDLNKLQHLVIAKNIGISDSEKILSFTNSMDTVNHVIAASENSASASNIPVYPADYFLKDLDCPRLVKIDVEGYEDWVLKGMPIILNDEGLKGIIIELNGSGYKYGIDEMQIHLDLQKLYFHPYSYDPFTRKLTLLEKHGDTNTIYLKDLVFVKERIVNAEKVHLFSESF